MEENIKLITLPNGIRLLYREVKGSEIVHCGFMINSGSRDENPQNNGIAHFIEHTVFKGTEKRKSHHILRRIEDVGGELNAYTTREKTCYYASCLKEYAGRAIELLSDITFSSVFPEKELEKEKKVILEEIDMYEDSPEESIYDTYYQSLFGDHPLGFNILGTKETVSSFTRETLINFIQNNYTSNRIVLSIVGDIDEKKANKLAMKFLDGQKLTASNTLHRLPPPITPVSHNIVEKDFVQTHFITGNRAYARTDKRRFALSLVSNLLGGYGMSSRLNMAVREKHGLVYQIGSHYSLYEDSGVYTIYFGCDQKNLNRCKDIVMRELKKMREQKLSGRQLLTAKKQFLGQLAIVSENNSAQMQHQARSLLDFGRVISFSELMAEVDKVTSEEILEVSNDIFNPNAMSSLTYLQES